MSKRTKKTEAEAEIAAGPPKLTKRQWQALEKVFAAEIEGKPYHNESGSGYYCRLRDAGFVQWQYGHRWPVRQLAGWILTELGRYAYCSSIERFVSPEELAAMEKEMDAEGKANLLDR